MHVIDATTIAQALPFEQLIPALRQLFAQGCEVPARQILPITTPGGEVLTTMIMPAWLTGKFYGVKVINMSPANAARGLPGLHASYLLHDAVTGVPLCVMDGDELTLRRTAAASALAASYLARKDATHLLVVGAGRVAALLPQAYRAVRDVQRVTVWARRDDEAQRLAQLWQSQGFEAQAVQDLQAAVKAADIISCATLATSPVVHGDWLQAGSHLDLIGSFTPAMREADDVCFTHAALFVDTPEALKKSGDLLEPLQRGVITPDDVRADLAALCRGHVLGRETEQERTVFKSVGTALEDLAAAMLVQAHQHG
jgi:ornithine cyclodeaminase/alanine dehydrogenase-like protein (mu-crystallin family)